MEKAKAILFFLILFFAVGCTTKSEKKAPNVLIKSRLVESTEDVSIELSMPHGDELRRLGICWEENHVDVIIRNQTDSAIYLYQNWNSWGYYNFSFQIETADSIYTIKRTQSAWWKNFPSTHFINPQQSLVFHFNLIDSTCPKSSGDIIISKNEKLWVGLPKTRYASAKMRVIYELPEVDRIKTFRRMTNIEECVKKEDAEIKFQMDSNYIYPRKLVSKSVDISIVK